MSAPYDPDDILTAQEVGQILRFRPETIRKWARAGYLPSRRSGRRVFFSRTELIAWINERRQGGE
jgi:excisionase family DNA binding protein